MSKTHRNNAVQRHQVTNMKEGRILRSVTWSASGDRRSHQDDWIEEEIQEALEEQEASREQ